MKMYFILIINNLNFEINQNIICFDTLASKTEYIFNNVLKLREISPGNTYHRIQNRTFTRYMLCQSVIITDV